MGGPPRRVTGIVVRNLRAIWRRLRRHHDVPEICAMRTWEDAMPTPPRRRQRRADGLSGALGRADLAAEFRSEEPPSELQSLMRISYAVFCLQNKKLNTRKK